MGYAESLLEVRMSARTAARVRLCLRGFWERQRERAERRSLQLASSLGSDLPVYCRFSVQAGIPPTFETPRTHHTHTDLRRATNAHPR